MVMGALRRVRHDVAMMAREQLASRELLRAFVWRDLMVRYRQAVFGVGWAVLTPLLNVLVFTMIFTRVVPLETTVPYPVFAYAGLWPWTFLAAATRSATVSLTANAALVSKVAFAREVLPFAAILVALVDFLVAGVLMAALMAWYDVPASLSLAALPLVILVQVVFTAGVGLVLSAANLYWRDTRHVVDAGLMAWMLATSVVYPMDRVGGRLGALLALNPMTPIIDAYRAVLLEGRLPAAGPLCYAATVATLLLLGGWLAFHRAELTFAERV